MEKDYFATNTHTLKNVTYFVGKQNDSDEYKCINLKTGDKYKLDIISVQENGVVIAECKELGFNCLFSVAKDSPLYEEFVIVDEVQELYNGEGVIYSAKASDKMSEHTCYIDKLGFHRLISSKQYEKIADVIQKAKNLEIKDSLTLETNVAAKMLVILGKNTKGFNSINIFAKEPKYGYLSVDDENNPKLVCVDKRGEPNGQFMACDLIKHYKDTNYALVYSRQDERVYEATTDPSNRDVFGGVAEVDSCEDIYGGYYLIGIMDDENCWNYYIVSPAGHKFEIDEDQFPFIKEIISAVRMSKHKTLKAARNLQTEMITEILSENNSTVEK